MIAQHTQKTVVVSHGSDLCMSVYVRPPAMRLSYNGDGLSLVVLGGVLVGGSRDDLGQADRCAIVSLPPSIVFERRIAYGDGWSWTS